MEKNKIKTPKIKIPESLFLSPMVRINTLPFRLLCFELGCDYTFTEEIISKKLKNSKKVFNKDLNTYDYIHNKDNTLILRISPSEINHLFLQIGASNVEDAIESIKIVKDEIIGVDLNMGCPKHFSTHGNMGSSLLNYPELAKEILTQMKINFPNKLISCKIRLLEDNKKFEFLIENILQSNIDFISIHFRYKEQNSKFPANWEKISYVKKLLNNKIPFNINGDVLSPKDIYYLHKLHPECGFLIGRGAIHNPNIFNEYKNNEKNLELEFDNNKINNIKEINNKEIKLNEDVKNNDIKDEEVKISIKLTKELSKKYNKDIDIIPLVKRYIEICLEYGNNFGNTKYNILYILKTHKKFIELFQKIQKIKEYKNLVELFELKDYYENILKNHPDFIKYYNNIIIKKEEEISNEINN